MASFEALFVEVTPGAHAAAVEALARAGKRDRVLRLASRAEFEPDLPWLRFRVPWEEISLLGRSMTAVLPGRAVGLAEQTSVGSFGFWHFQAGRETRSLLYGFRGEEDGLWNQVEGAPESWEKELLFRSSEELEAILETVYADDLEVARRAYRDREFVLGGRYPEPGAIDAELFGFYDLPAYPTQSLRLGPGWPWRKFDLFWPS